MGRNLVGVVVALLPTLGTGVSIAGATRAVGASSLRGPIAAVADSPATILHVAVTVSETKGSGSVTNWSEEAWIGFPLGTGRLNQPAGFRQILRHSGISVQTGVFGRGLYSLTRSVSFPGTELYDPSTNTINELQPVYYGPPFLKSPPPAGCGGTVPAGFVAGVPAAYTGSTKAGDARIQADALAGGVYLGGPSARPFFSGFNSTIPYLWSPCFSKGLSQAHSGLDKRVGAGRVDGRRVIEFVATDGSWTYYEDARTHQPVRLVVRGIYGTKGLAPPPSKPAPATLTFNIQTYEQLPFRRNEQLLSLAAQHPGARIDTNTEDYYAAQGRLFPLRSWG